jgi:UDP-4-amino-4,6-dideoxy-N-acetyl-beta-L-altrosamine N-acetyltransferase
LNLKKNYYLEEGILINFNHLSDKERELVRKWRNHQEVRKWMYEDKIISPAEHADFIKQLAKDNRRFYWLVQNRVKENIGVIYMINADFKNRHAYLGIYSNPRKKTPGTGACLMSLLKEVATRFARFHTLKLDVLANNKRAIRFYEKSGFKREGLLQEYVFKEGKWVDVVVMGITVGKVTRVEEL